LTVLSAVLSPNAPEPGNETSILAQLHNAGLRDAEGFEVNASIDGEEVVRTRVDALASQARDTVEVGHWTARGGVPTLHVTVDPAGQVEETTTTNNTFATEFRLGQDLSLNGLEVRPENPSPGDAVSVTVTVENNASKPTPETRIAFSADDREIGQATIPELAPGQSTTASVEWTATPAETLHATIDPDDDVDEVSEDNNRVQHSLGLEAASGAIDLTIVGVDWNETAVEDEAGVNFTAQVANAGEIAAPATTVVFAVNGERLGDPVALDPLPSGEFANVTSSAWNASSGEHEIEVTVDPNDDVREGNETNNTRTSTLREGPVGVPAPAFLALVAPVLVAWCARARRE
jgi:subtilase family serine protease